MMQIAIAETKTLPSCPDLLRLVAGIHFAEVDDVGERDEPSHDDLLC